ncbi:MAG: ABC transporter ATP-binding protein [Clostridia bacterium]|nr:ABC transporter ATP-binding protein [Clostridia bacterium]
MNRKTDQEIQTNGQALTKQELKKLRGQFKHTLFHKNHFNLFMTLVAAVLCSVSAIVSSWLLKEVLDLTAGNSRFDLYTLLIIAGCCGLLLLLGGVIDYCFLSRFRAKAMKQYRAFVFDKILQKGIQAFSRESTSLYISALSNDVNTIEQEYLRPLQTNIEAGLSFAGALALMLWYSPLLTLISIGFSLLPIIFSVIFGNMAAMAEKNVSDQKERYTGVQKDALTGFKVIKSFKAENSISKLHEQKNQDVAQASRKRVKASVLVTYSSMLSSVVVQFGVFFVAAAFALAGKGITVGTVLIFVQLMNYLLSPIQLFPNFFAGRQSALRLMEKLAVALHQNIPDEGEPIAPQLTEGISLRNLDFAYEENKPVLNGIGMEISAGGCYALVGGSGSGKSTILNLLMAGSRDYSGEILYDGKELKTVSPSSLYDLVSIIQQNVFVFNSTIRDNITMFSPFPGEEVERAVQMSGLKKLIEEKGEDYLCGENGSGLSGGERQRISIARALLRNTPVLLIDEATASLDNETSFEVLDAILKLDGYTRVIVTHDLDENILRRCTGIFTLKKGELSEQGTFDELMNQKGYFYSLFTVSQT